MLIAEGWQTIHMCWKRWTEPWNPLARKPTCRSLKTTSLLAEMDHPRRRACWTASGRAIRMLAPVSWSCTLPWSISGLAGRVCRKRIPPMLFRRSSGRCLSTSASSVRSDRATRFAVGSGPSPGTSSGTTSVVGSIKQRQSAEAMPQRPSTLPLEHGHGSTDGGPGRAVFQ